MSAGPPTIATTARALQSGEMSALALLAACQARIDDPTGQGRATFTHLCRVRAQIEAQVADLRHPAGLAPGPLSGVPVSVKDLFDVAGLPTQAAARVLDDAPPASADAEIVRRLRAAGAVIIGKTNMTEFAFSGIGWNPHYGTPLNPWDRAGRRIPGGSSSGAAVSVSDRMAVAAIGTDTGGSVRIPAALCGLYGFKPTARRVPRTGLIPLSTTLDSVGPIAASVECCALLDAILSGAALSGAAPKTLPFVPLAGMRLLAVDNYVLSEMDGTVAAAYDAALRRLSDAGARISARKLPPLDDLATINAHGGFAGAEAFAWHRDLLARCGAGYDPRVRVRIERGGMIDGAGYVDLAGQRAGFIAQMAALVADFDALLFPTVPIIAPTLAQIADDDDFSRLNMLILRNNAWVNFLDGCALTVPCHPPGTAPVGLSIAGIAGQDQRILAIGKSVAAQLWGSQNPIPT